VGSGRVDRLALAGRRPVAQAVVRRAQVRAALDHPARDVRPRFAGNEAAARVGHPRVARHAAGPVVRSPVVRSPVVRSRVGRLRGEVVARPLPYVAGHVVQAVAVGREALYRGRAALAWWLQVLPGELALPGIRHHLPLGERVIAPGVDRAVQPAAGGELPLGLGWQLLARPLGVRVGVLGGHVGDRVPVQAARRAARPAGMPPVGARGVPPPPRHVPQVHRPAGGEEHQRAGAQQVRVRAGVLRRVERPLGHGRVPGRGHEPAELRDRDRVIVYPEAVDLDAARRAFLRVEVLGSHQELAARHPGHVLAGRATHGTSWRRPP
jgi:hypothetical protein